MNISATKYLGSAPGQAPANKGRKFPAEPLTPAEADALIGACSPVSRTGIRNRALLTVMYRGGLRVAEVLALKVSDIDPARGTIRVLHGKGNRARTIGLDPGAMAVVQRWADTRRAAGIRGGTLFCTLAGGRVSDKYVRALLGRLAARAGVDKRVHPHGFRHTHAVELEMSRVASDATFGGSRERALPAVQRATPGQAPDYGSLCTQRDLGCHHPVAPSRTMMQPVRLHQIRG
jgi:site-specific recombinase XerC